MSSDSVVKDLQDFVRRLDAAWLNRRFEELEHYFHPDVVVVAPDLTTRVAGREACIASYRDFMTTARVHSFDSRPAQVDLASSTAVAVTPYEIDYELSTGRWRGTGKEVLVLERDGNDWLVVWRYMAAGEEMPVTAAPG
jgi:ketosteroid isomerase-like protein